MAGIADYFSTLMPQSLTYVYSEIRKSAEDLSAGRKFYRNLVRLGTTASTMVFSGLLPNVIAPNMGNYLSGVFSSLLSTSNAAFLGFLSTGTVIVIGGCVALVASKQGYRLYQYHKHGDTNSDHVFDERRYKNIVEQYREVYPETKLESLEKKVQDDVEYMVRNIKRRKSLEKVLEGLEKSASTTGKSKLSIEEKQKIANQKYKDQSKADFKFMLALYEAGDDSVFNDHVEIYPKIKALFAKTYADAGLKLVDFIRDIEKNNSDHIEPKDLSQVTANLHKLSQLQEAGAQRTPAITAPISENKEHIIHIPAHPEEEKYSDLKTEPPCKDPLLFMQRYLPQALREKYRDSATYAKDLHSELALLIPKLEQQAQQQAAQAENAKQVQLRRRSV